jgi:hypothetical protein
MTHSSLEYFQTELLLLAFRGSATCHEPQGATLLGSLASPLSLLPSQTLHRSAQLALVMGSLATSMFRPSSTERTLAALPFCDLQRLGTQVIPCRQTLLHEGETAASSERAIAFCQTRLRWGGGFHGDDAVC